MNNITPTFDIDNAPRTGVSRQRVEKHANDDGAAHP